jgi:hypothetical protein
MQSRGGGMKEPFSHEIAALGGIMGKVADSRRNHAQSIRPAVQGPRAPVDRKRYRSAMTSFTLTGAENISVIVVQQPGCAHTSSRIVVLPQVMWRHGRRCRRSDDWHLSWGVMHIGKCLREPGDQIGAHACINSVTSYATSGFRSVGKTGAPPR